MKCMIRQSEIATLQKLNNLFIELTAKNCNQKCKHCYIKFPQFKKTEDFIKIETISKALETLWNKNIEFIYLTGAEPMTHPDFNTILRLCLKKANVCICTNGSFINEKKARFLKKVENESEHEIIFEISLDHYDEVKNDDVRYRGSYRQAIFAVKHLAKYNFSPIIHTTNYYNESWNNIYNNFKQIFSNIEYELDNKHLKITPWHNIESEYDNNIKTPPKAHLDCQYGRVLTAKGIYSCPFLSDDYRGRCGSSFENFSTKTPLETAFCQTCFKSEYEIFGINTEKFK